MEITDATSGSLPLVSKLDSKPGLCFLIPRRCVLRGGRAGTVAEAHAIPGRSTRDARPAEREGLVVSGDVSLFFWKGPRARTRDATFRRGGRVRRAALSPVKAGCFEPGIPHLTAARTPFRRRSHRRTRQ
eukprot:gene23279-biopygen4310